MFRSEGGAKTVPLKFYTSYLILAVAAMLLAAAPSHALPGFTPQQIYTDNPLLLAQSQRLRVTPRSVGPSSTGRLGVQPRQRMVTPKAPTISKAKPKGKTTPVPSSVLGSRGGGAQNAARLRALQGTKPGSTTGVANKGMTGPSAMDTRTRRVTKTKTEHQLVNKKTKAAALKEPQTKAKTPAKLTAKPVTPVKNGDATITESTISGNRAGGTPSSTGNPYIYFYSRYGETDGAPETTKRPFMDALITDVTVPALDAGNAPIGHGQNEKWLRDSTGTWYATVSPNYSNPVPENRGLATPDGGATSDQDHDKWIDVSKYRLTVGTPGGGGTSQKDSDKWVVIDGGMVFHTPGGGGTGSNNPRQQINQITSYIDSSTVYGPQKDTPNASGHYTYDAYGNLLARGGANTIIDSTLSGNRTNSNAQYNFYHAWPSRVDGPHFDSSADENISLNFTKIPFDYTHQTSSVETPRTAGVSPNFSNLVSKKGGLATPTGGRSGTSKDTEHDQWSDAFLIGNAARIMGGGATDNNNPRQQINQITSYIDASNAVIGIRAGNAYVNVHSDMPLIGFGIGSLASENKANASRKMPGRHKFENITLERGITSAVGGIGEFKTTGKVQEGISLITPAIHGGPSDYAKAPPPKNPPPSHQNDDCMSCD